MRKFFLFLLPSLLAFAQTYIERPLEEKLKAKDLSFFVSFDKMNLNADFALGDRMSTTLPNADLLLRGQVGFDTQQGYKPQAGESLKFNVAKNVDPHKGTLILWTAGLGYNPQDEQTDGKNRGNIALAHIVTYNGNRYIDYQLYEFGATVYFDWRSSDGSQAWGSVGRVSVNRSGIRKGQWHQIAVTWDDSKIMIYLNGEKKDEMTLPEKVNLTSDIVAQDNPNSYIGIKCPFYEDKHTWDVAVDDAAIYSRPLSALEIHNQYARLLKDKGEMVVKDYAITLNGVVTSRDDKIDRLEAEFDFAALPDALKEKLLSKGVTMKWELTGPDSKKKSGKWTFSKLNECRILTGVNQVGKYTLSTSIGDSKVTESVNRPDFSWVGNGIGDEDVVPEIWKDFAVNGRDITLWNRKYHFGKGPLPESITCYGTELLAVAPKLLIDGKEPQWKEGKTRRINRLVTFTGKGKLGKAVINYETTVEYDGMIHFKWSIKGKPHIDKMELKWQMAAANHQYLLTPYLNESKESQVAFTYPKASGNDKQLWFVSAKKGGFAYTMPTDGNWRYEEDKPVFFADKSNGACRVEMINIPTDMPDDVPYQAVFIATPTRPFPKQIRGGQYNDVRPNASVKMTHGGGTGYFNTVFTHAPCDNDDFQEKYENTLPNILQVYGGLCALSTKEAEALYLRKYWEIPRAYSYKMGLTHKMPDGSYQHDYYFSLSACSATVYGDYPVLCDKLLFDHPCGNKFYQSYYDLCGDGLCSNKLHGCGYTDKFGREVSTFALLNKRDIIRRLVVLAHRYGKTLMLHGQRDFIPAMDGMADFWYPGEQNQSILQRNPYAYVDDITDEIYKSEYNRDVLGVGVINCIALCHASMSYFKEPAFKYTEALISMMQLHDVEIDRTWCAGPPVEKTWDTLRKYGVYSDGMECHLYYEQNEVKADKENIRITYYKCPGDKYVLFIANKNTDDVSTTVDLSALTDGTFDAQEEFRNQPVKVTNGKFETTVPGRSFQIVCFPPVPDFPVRDDFSTSWGSWAPQGSDSKFSMDTDNGNICVKHVTHGTGNGCYVKSYKFTEGKKYIATIKFKQIGGENANVSLNAQAFKNEQYIGSDPSKGVAGKDWQVLTLKYGSSPIWQGAQKVQFVFGTNSKDATVIFDDFTIDEE